MKPQTLKFLVSDIIVIIHYFGVVSSFGIFDRHHFMGDLSSSDTSSGPQNEIAFGLSSQDYIPASSAEDEESSSSYTDRETGFGSTEQHSAVTVCQRVPRHVFIGRDATGASYELDTGECRHLAIPTGYYQTETFGEICDITSPCESNRNRTERNTLLAGDSRYDVIEECTCRKSGQMCGRQTFFRTFFPNSPHETTLDVGKCSGGCDKEGCDGCFPTRKVTTSIQGPNGEECVEKVVDCSCTSNCRRESWFETYYMVTWDDTTNATVTTKQTFDVGRCTGTCAPRPFCLVRDTRTGKCTSSLNTPTKCSRTSFTTHTFTTPDEMEKTVLTADACVCV